MALTEEDKKEIIDLIAKEEAERKKSILSSLSSLARWLQGVANIVVAIDKLQPLFDFLLSLFS